MTTPKSQNPEGKVVAWVHTLHMELGQKTSRVSMKNANPFGSRGVDYDRSYTVTSEALVPATTLTALQAENARLQSEAEGLRVAAAAVLKRDGDTACKCIHISRQAEREYESGKCPHQRLAAVLRGDGKGEGEVSGGK